MATSYGMGWGKALQPGSHTAPETTETTTEKKVEVDTTSLLPKRDRSRNMGAHTECMASKCVRALCTKYEKHSKLDDCRHRRFEFMCTWVDKEGYIK